MDDVVAAAAVAVWHEDDARARRWFELVTETYDADPLQEWDEFSQAFAASALAEGYSQESVDAFVEHVSNAASPIEVISGLADPDELDDLVAASRNADGHAEGAGEQAYDQDRWYEYLHQWDGGWDGLQESWANFAERVIYYAPDDLKGIAGEFVSYCELSGDRVAALSHYGLSIAAADAAAGAGLASDEAAGTADVHEIDVAAHVDEMSEHVITPALAELFEEMPEAATLPPEVLRQLLTEVLEEHLSAAGTAAGTGA